MASAVQFERGRAGRTAQVQPSREWLGLRELSQYAAVSERTLRSWLRLPVNPLPAAQVGTKILVRRSQFDAWLERHRIKPRDFVDVDAIVSTLVRNAR
jgi:excisionase family DNA binding protein